MPDQVVIAIVVVALSAHLVSPLACLWAHRRRGWPRVASYGAFGLHLCASVAALLFPLTFRITRLI